MHHRPVEPLPQIHPLIVAALELPDLRRRPMGTMVSRGGPGCAIGERTAAAMKRMIGGLFLVGLVVMSSPAAASDKPLSFSIGGGVATPVGGAGESLGSGGQVTIGLGYKVQPQVTVFGEYNFSSLGREGPRGAATAHHRTPRRFTGNGWYPVRRRRRHLHAVAVREVERVRAGRRRRLLSLGVCDHAGHRPGHGLPGPTGSSATRRRSRSTRSWPPATRRTPA